jgi:hypothetical protein
MQTKRAVMTSAFVVGGCLVPAVSHAPMKAASAFGFPRLFGSFDAAPGERR